MTNIITTKVPSTGYKLVLHDDHGSEIGYVYLFVMSSKPNTQFGLLENLFINEKYRGQGFGTQLVEAVVELAKQEKCYKLICTSRYTNEKAHHLYTKTGFIDWGKEFRLNL
jgi:GNAT superfamily N-acetyltransferase